MLKLRQDKHVTRLATLILLLSPLPVLVFVVLLQLDIFVVGKAALLVFPACAFFFYRANRKNFF